MEEPTQATNVDISDPEVLFKEVHSRDFSTSSDSDAMEEPTQATNVDISDPEVLFKEIQSRVKDTPLYSSFLNVLLFINQIDNTQACSKEIWCTIEEFVRQEVTERDVRETDERGDFPLTTQPKDILPSITSPCSTGTLPPPPPPAPPPPRGQGTVETRLRPINTPKPKCKLKHVSWGKISSVDLIEKSVWIDILKMENEIEVNYDELETLYVDKERVTQKKRHSSCNKVTLLDPKKSMNVNIFLKQFRKPTDVIIDLLRAGDPRAFGVEKLKGLSKILPQQDEIDLIKTYEGSIDDLDEVEKFYHDLIQVPNYQFQIEALILKGDFYAQFTPLRENFKMLQTLCPFFFDNRSLKRFLRYALHIGAFLNKGRESGNALGIRMSTVEKLMDTKCSSGHTNLLQYIVKTSEQKDPEALAFVKTLLEPLQRASRFTVKDLTGEFFQLKGLVHSLNDQCEHVEPDVRVQFEDFLKKAEEDLKEVHRDLEKIPEQSTQLAEYFCENKNTFNLDEFLAVFRRLCEKINSCK
ncbi:FH2 domain-containing protein 1-like [Crassostrea virginica]